MKYNTTFKLSILALSLTLVLFSAVPVAHASSPDWGWCGFLCAGNSQGTHQSPMAPSEPWQSSRAQYDSDEELNSSKDHDCSTVAMTYILDTEYAKNYRVHDVLQPQISVGEIHANGAMVAVLNRTLNQLGYHEKNVQGGIDAIVATANAGSPVLVGVDAYRGSSLRWQEPHVIIVTGGDSTTVHTVPAPPLSMDIPRSDFASIYEGVADVVISGGANEN